MTPLDLVFLTLAASIVALLTILANDVSKIRNELRKRDTLPKDH